MKKQYSLGCDIGSSSIKVSLLDLRSGETIASDYSPKKEMAIHARFPGWAEQNPDTWWDNLVLATRTIIKQSNGNALDIISIGISYQMHGLVMLDKNQEVLYPSIIWCDSRAISIGDAIINDLGYEHCLSNYLNSPGNFTISKLKWIKDNEPDIFSKIDKIILPGDYIAYKLTGEISTTIPGLSEGVFWNFKNQALATDLMDYCEFPKSIIPEITDTFGHQGKLSKEAAMETGLEKGIPVSYRAGDQPNNAFSLNAIKSGEFAATAGTSGVVYGVSSQPIPDEGLRVNIFANVNYSIDYPVYGVLLCINGTGILNSWLKNTLFSGNISYEEMNLKAEKINIGSDGLRIFPFGNGTERMLNNSNQGAQVLGLDFNLHTRDHVMRAVQEGIANAFRYGIDLLNDLDLQPKVIRAGNTNLFLSPLFCEVFTNVCNTPIEIYNTDGAQGAARGAAFGSGFYESMDDALKNLKMIKSYEPDSGLSDRYDVYYQAWKEQLQAQLQQ